MAKLFALDRDKTGSDDRCYTGITNGSIWRCRVQGGLENAMYLLEQHLLGVSGSDAYEVTNFVVTKP